MKSDKQFKEHLKDKEKLMNELYGRSESTIHLQMDGTWVIDGNGTDKKRNGRKDGRVWVRGSMTIEDIEELVYWMEYVLQQYSTVIWGE